MQPIGALAHQYAMRMEHIIKENYPSIPLDADSFDIHPREALAEALEYLRLDGRIQEGEIANLLNDYDFGDSSLRAFFEKKDGEEKYKELIARITDIVKRPKAKKNEKETGKVLERLTGIKNKVVNWISCVSFGLSLIFICIGFDKLSNYKNGDSYPYDLHNAYVGGDAYNYIINGNYATAYFVLATLFVVIGLGLLICAYLKQAHCVSDVKSETSEIESQNFAVEEA